MTTSESDGQDRATGPLARVGRAIDGLSVALAMALDASFGEPSRVAKRAQEHRAVLAVPALGMTLACTAVFAEALFPSAAGYVLGGLVGAVLGSIGWWAAGTAIYFPFTLLSPGASLGEFVRWHSAGAGPLLLAGFLSVVLHLGSAYYFRLPWYSASVFLILGVVWSAFATLRIASARLPGRMGIVVLGLYLAVAVPVGLGYLLPFAATETLALFRALGLMKGVQLVW